MVLRVVFLHPEIHNITEMLNYLFIKDEEIEENLIWDESNPEIVFASETIFTHQGMFSDFKKLYSKDRIFILHGGEAVYPDLNIFDYAIAYCTYMKEFDRVIKAPEGDIYMRELAEQDNKFDKRQAIDSLNGRDFCNFIYSNPFSHPKRDAFFHLLSDYKKVASLGGHLNNTNKKCTRNNANWLEESIELKSGYKFSIAFENAIYAGYISEKLLTSFRAHTVPIYWGNPRVSDYYNSNAFINCHDYGSFDEVIDRIKEIDHDDNLWASIVSEPWQTEEQKKLSRDDHENYMRFFHGILTTNDLNSYIRRPSGTWTDFYYEWFFRNFRPQSFYKRVVRKMRRVLKEFC